MLVWDIIGETEETQEYDPCTFILTDAGNIYSECPEFGFWKRDDWNFDRLMEHLETMRSEGFTVKER